jgi:hypothetical protein
MLFDALLDSVSYQLAATVQAAGKIKFLQIIIGNLLLLNIPMSYIILSRGGSDPGILIISIFLTFFAFIWGIAPLV